MSCNDRHIHYMHNSNSDWLISQKNQNERLEISPVLIYQKVTSISLIGDSIVSCGLRVFLEFIHSRIPERKSIFYKTKIINLQFITLSLHLSVVLQRQTLEPPLATAKFPELSDFLYMNLKLHELTSDSRMANYSIRFCPLTE